MSLITNLKRPIGLGFDKKWSVKTQRIDYYLVGDRMFWNWTDHRPICQSSWKYWTYDSMVVTNNHESPLAHLWQHLPHDCLHVAQVTAAWRTAAGASMRKLPHCIFKLILSHPMPVIPNMSVSIAKMDMIRGGSTRNYCQPECQKADLENLKVKHGKPET